MHNVISASTYQHHPLLLYCPSPLLIDEKPARSHESRTIGMYIYILEMILKICNFKKRVGIESGKNMQTGWKYSSGLLWNGNKFLSICHSYSYCIWFIVDNMWLDLQKPTIYTQETYKIITGISLSFIYNLM